jgi:hypothetical protein
LAESGGGVSQLNEPMRRMSAGETDPARIRREVERDQAWCRSELQRINRANAAKWRR